jgi:hypothetical protein
MSSSPVLNFMRQQGFAEEPKDACDLHFEGLYFQPRIVFPTVLLAIALQFVAPFAAIVLHLVVAAVLSWNTLVPRLNPFELAYNALIARAEGRRPLVPAPGPRRFAQGMAAALTLGAALALYGGHHPTAWVLQGLLVVAFSALLFGRFCLGAYVYHLLRGRVAFANSTLPWARG